MFPCKRAQLRLIFQTRSQPGIAYKRNMYHCFMSSKNEEITTLIVCFSFFAFIWYFNRTMLSKKCFQEQGECKKDKNERWLYRWLFIIRGAQTFCTKCFFFTLKLASLNLVFPFCLGFLIYF